MKSLTAIFSEHQKEIIAEMERRMTVAREYARDEAWRSVDAGKPVDARRYAISARRSMVIAQTWEAAIQIVTGSKA
jgi:hypothetical protein